MVVVLMVGAISVGSCQAPAKGSAAIHAALAPATPEDLVTLNLASLLPQPPSAESAQTFEELRLLHRVESTRTAGEVAAAKADDAEEDIFIFRSVVGSEFTADRYPLTARLGQEVHAEEAAVSKQLKTVFARPRPYQMDGTLHPVCKQTAAANSYPSGHTLSGYLLALTLAELLPEKKEAILGRADEYAQHRLICGVHYPSDLEASRRLAYVVFGYLLSNAQFSHDLQASRNELHSYAAVAVQSSAAGEK
jgi:acid phosphatase (class A)